MSRRWSHAGFLVGFAAYALLVAGWLLVGLAAVLADRYDAIRDLLTSLGPGDWGHLFPPPSVSVEVDNAHAVLDYAYSLTLFVFALLLVRLRGRHPVIRLLAFGLIGNAGAFNLTSHRSLDVVLSASHYDIDLWHLLLMHCVSGVCFIYAVILFPDGHWPKAGGHRQPRLLRTGIVGPLIVLANVIVVPAALSTGTAHAAFFVVFYGVAVPVIGLAVQLWRQRLATTAQERRRSQLLLGALWLALTAAIGLGALTWAVSLASLPGFGVRTPEGFIFVVFRELSVILPLTVAVAVVRHNLWDIDRLCSRTLRYGLLVGLISVGYVVVVYIVSAMVRGRGLLPSVLATAVVAAAVQPLRERVAGLADRLVYGRRAAPHQLMTDLANRVLAAAAVDDVPRLVAEAASEAVAAARVRVTVLTPDGRVTAGEGTGPWDLVVSAEHLGEPAGEIAVALPDGEQIDDLDRRLLSDLAAQAAPALAAVGLNARLLQLLVRRGKAAEDLRHSCRAIVVTAAAERRRIEHAIHDDAQQELLGLRLALGAAEQLDDGVRRDLATRVDRAERILRELALGIGPLLLVDRGLVAAVRAAADGLPVSSTVHAIGVGDLRFARQVETAAYFCVAEAVHNSTRYAFDAPVHVRLTLEDSELVVEIRDEGPGFDAAAVVEGTGLTGLRERVATAGGSLEVRSSPGMGTMLRARLPATPGALVEV